jgi:hypothetical protein
MMRIAISLEEEQARGLARMAHEAGLTEEELLQEAVDQLLSWRTPSVPRFARRVGPLASPRTHH